MLRVFTGPFHPSLETALVDDLRTLKTQDPQAAAALVVPSAPLRRYLKRLLVLEHRLALLNLHILSFHQLALQLDRERLTGAGNMQDGQRLELVSDFFFEHLLRHLGQRNLPQTGALRLRELPPGAWAALWASLRDLKDGLVDPAVALRAVEEGQFGVEDREKLKGLFTLLAALYEVRTALQVGSPDDLAALVTEFVPRSGFLGGLQRLYYYGSYDLTQTQLTLLEVLSARLEVTLYFPLGSSSAYGFAQRFLERHLHPVMARFADLRSAAPVREVGQGTAGPEVSVVTMNAAGADDELTLVCKQILTLVETNGYRFDEIGVVGRTLAPYQGSLQRIFDEHRIPFASSATVPILQEPAVKTLLHLAQLKINGFYRPSVLDVVSSPWYRAPADEGPGPEPRPDLWRIAVLALGITRGEDEWGRLGQRDRIKSWSDLRDEQQEDAGPVLSVEQVQLRLLWSRVKRLLDDVAVLPRQGSYAELTDAFVVFAERHLSIPDGSGGLGGSVEALAEEPGLGRALATVFAQLRDLDRLGATVRWEEWVQTFAEALERATYVPAPAEFRAVEVLDAMAARGLGFRALFVIGLNEKLFPRFIQEDGFLRDRHRLVLDETLGYKLDQKLHGYAEEVLLFELLRSAARERLYLSYQRVDAEGRLLAPSAYLAQNPTSESRGLTPPELSLPRRWGERGQLALFAPPLLTREELTVAMVLEGHDVSSLMTALGRDAQVFSHGVAAQATLEGDTQRLGPYDGMLHESGGHWTNLLEKGLSPTGLETYTRCPFQYFSEKVLGLESVRRVPTAELPPAALGLLCHDALRRCYGSLIEQGWPAKEVTPELVHDAVAHAIDQAFAEYAAEHGTGYPLTWQLARERVTGVVEAVIEFDRGEAEQTGSRPVAFEVEADGYLPADIAGEELPIRGRWDRVDRVGSSGPLRVIDYKYRPGGEVKPEDRNLVQAAVRGKRLQPALYALMRPTSLPEQSAGPPEQVDFLYLLPQGSRAVQRASFPLTGWSGASGDQLRRNVGHLVDGVRVERFFILPDGYCAYCDFAVACRRSHHSTWWRSYRSPEARALRLLRRTRLDRE